MSPISTMELTAHLTDNTGDELITPKQLAQFLSVSQKTLERHRVAGDGVPFVRISPKVIRYRRADIQEFIRGRVTLSRAA